MALSDTLKNFADEVIGRNNEETITKAIEALLIDLHLINPATAPAEVLAKVASANPAPTEPAPTEPAPTEQPPTPTV
jgi:hypothetical protein